MVRTYGLSRLGPMVRTHGRCLLIKVRTYGTIRGTDAHGWKHTLLPAGPPCCQHTLLPAHPVASTSCCQHTLLPAGPANLGADRPSRIPNPQGSCNHACVLH